MEIDTNDRKVQAARIPLRPYRERLVDKFIAQHPQRNTWGTDVLKYNRNSLMTHIGERGVGKEFRDWLYADGIMLVRKDRRWYLHFFDGAESSKFVLMHS